MRMLAVVVLLMVGCGEVARTNAIDPCPDSHITQLGYDVRLCGANASSQQASIGVCGVPGGVQDTGCYLTFVDSGETVDCVARCP